MDDYRIANANTQCGRITNPTERTERKSDRAENVPGPGTFLSGPLMKKSGPLMKKSGPLMKKSGPHFSQNNLFWFPGNSHSSLITHPLSLITSSPVQPKNLSRAYPVRARVLPPRVCRFCRDGKIAFLQVTDPTPNPSPTREGRAYGVPSGGQGGSRSPPL